MYETKTKGFQKPAAFVLTILMFLGTFSTLFAPGVKAGEGITKTELVNVAQNKPILNPSVNNTGTEAWSLVDGDVRQETYWSGGSASIKASATIDLLRKYEIEKIVVFDRACNQHGRFHIYGSNDPTFTEKELLHELDDPTAFVAATGITIEKIGEGYVINLSQKPMYRYVIFEAINVGEMLLREIQVYSKVTVTEISRGAYDYVSHSFANQPGSYAVDGNLGTRYVSNVITGKHPSLTIDLGDEHHVGMVELYTPFDSASPISTKSRFLIYGSHNAVTDFSGPENYAEKTPEEWLELEGYDYQPLTTQFPPEILSRPYDAGKETGQYPRSDGTYYIPFPTNFVSIDYKLIGDEVPVYYQATLNNSTAYRYITHRKEDFSQAQLAELRLYEIHPDFYDVKATDTGMTLIFSDEMGEETINGANILIHDVDMNVSVEYDSISLSADKTKANITFYPESIRVGGNYRVYVSENVKNTYNTALHGEQIKEFTIEASPGPFNVSDYTENLIITDGGSCSASFTFENTQPSGVDMSIMLVVAVYKGNSLEKVKADIKKVNVGTPIDFEASVDIPAGLSELELVEYNAKAFVWNMGTLIPVSID